MAALYVADPGMGQISGNLAFNLLVQGEPRSWSLALPALSGRKDMIRTWSLTPKLCLLACTGDIAGNTIAGIGD